MGKAPNWVLISNVSLTIFPEQQNFAVCYFGRRNQNSSIAIYKLCLREMKIDEENNLNSKRSEQREKHANKAFFK